MNGKQATDYRLKAVKKLSSWRIGNYNLPFPWKNSPMALQMAEKN